MSSRRPPTTRRRDRIPSRYAETPTARFERAVGERLAPGVAVLDVGSGRHPALPAEALGDIGRYVGLDVSSDELDAAPPGIYTETRVADLTRRADELVGAFELIVSRQVLEHVSDLAATLENIRAYLRPGGHLVAMLSGALALQAVLNRLIPSPVGRRLMRDLLGRAPDSVFPAYYDRCRHSALTELLEPWRTAEIEPMYQGGAYLNFSPLLRYGYLAYEDWACRTARADLATHYVIVAGR